MPPEGFARGGIASLGRNGDTMLAHITPDEAAMLRRRGGSGSINPATGLPEFFSLKGVFKKIGKAVKKFAGSTIGKIVIGAALFAVSGPAALAMFSGAGTAAVAAAQGFVASAGTSLLGGGNLKDSLKAGATGALTAGALKGVTQGKSAFKAIPKTPVEVRDVVAGVPGVGSGEAVAPSAVDTTATVPRSPLATAVTPPAPTATFQGTVRPPLLGAGTPIPPTAPSGVYNLPGASPSQTTQPFSRTLTPFPQGVTTAGTSTPTLDINPNEKVGIMQRLNRTFNPNEIKAAGLTRAQKAYTDTLAQTDSTELAQKAYDAAMPGMIRQYAPLVAGGLGIMAATGGFDAEEPEVPAGYEDMVKGISPGQKLLTANPEMYGLQFGGARTQYAYNPAQYAMPTAPARMRQGGVASLMGYKKGSPASYPRKTGQINGPGTGTSDDVPAMLSDGEFVFTAKAVRAMGNGSRRAGAKRMYALMKNLEGRKNG
jgi:hypothetical protein